ncbi:MAG TPA: hypothetical protein VMT18_15775 [Planctomycetota bacterium]|nr:hypothetical protein [Planctomycetota bacterium]
MRGPSARDVLQLAWEYPVFTPQAVTTPEGRTSAKQVRKALSAEEAFAAVAGDDPRPLLVLRECFVCNGTDDALLSRGQVDNEKTFLFSRWFHCVKLPPDVLEDDHPFKNLFPGGTSEHLFMATRDGRLRVPLESERSRTELWGSMVQVLSADYRSDPQRSLKEIQGLLDDLDAVDLEIARLQTRMDELLETDGPGSRKLDKIQKKLGQAKAERDTLLGEVTKASTLELKDATAGRPGEQSAG